MWISALYGEFLAAYIFSKFFLDATVGIFLDIGIRILKCCSIIRLFLCMLLLSSLNLRKNSVELILILIYQFGL